MVARLGDAAVDARRRRPIGGEELAQGSRRRIDETLEAKSRERVRHPVPIRVAGEREPRQGRFEQVHVRIGAAAGGGHRDLRGNRRRDARRLLERRAQSVGGLPPCRPDRRNAVAVPIGEQRKGLVVEIEGRIGNLAVEIDDRYHGRIRGHEMRAQEIERVPRRLAPGTGPAEPPGLAIAEGLPRDATRAPRPLARRPSRSIASWKPPRTRSPPTCHHSGSATSNSQRRSAAASLAKSLMLAFSGRGRRWRWNW